MLGEAKTKAEAQAIKHEIAKVAKLPTEVGKAVSKAMKDGEGFRSARGITNKMTEGRGVKAPPPSDKFIAALCKELAAFLSEHRDKATVQKLQAVLNAKADLPPSQLNDVAEMLASIAVVCMEWAIKFNPMIEMPKKPGIMKHLLHSHERSLKS
jgi:hypothetical protein